MKNKNIVTLVLATVLAVGLSHMVAAQVLPTNVDTMSDTTSDTTEVSKSMPVSMPFLTSKAALRTFAIESARSTFLELQSPGMVDPSWSIGTGWPAPLKEADVLNEFNRMQITIPMANIEDYVHATARICNVDGRPLFRGESWAKPELVKGGYVLPQMWFWFAMETVIPIKLNRSVTTVRFRHVGADGRTIGEPINLRVQNGYLDFQSDLAGQGILELWDNSGKPTEYDLRNGGKQVPVQQVLYAGSQSMIDGLYSFTDPSEINWQAWSWNGVGQNPAFEITMTTKNWVTLNVFSNEGAVPVGFHVRLMGNTDWVYYPVVAPSKVGQVPLNPGVFYIVPVWNETEFAEPEPQVPQSTPVMIDGKG